MTDRQQAAPLPADHDRETRRIFSEFTDQPNIVLLGDPGAGKTHLFRSFATATSGKFLTVRNFLNSPPGSGGVVTVTSMDSIHPHA